MVVNPYGCASATAPRVVSVILQAAHDAVPSSTQHERERDNDSASWAALTIAIAFYISLSATKSRLTADLRRGPAVEGWCHAKVV